MLVYKHKSALKYDIGLVSSDLAKCNFNSNRVPEVGSRASEEGKIDTRMEISEGSEGRKPGYPTRYMKGKIGI